MARRSAASLAAEAAEAAAAAQAAALEACLKFMQPEGSDPIDVALYTLAWHSLTLHYYDHRDAVGEEQSFPTGLRPIINQLKHTAEAPL